jgi:MFS transporter, DHA1 family, multidrug resistance protein
MVPGGQLGGCRVLCLDFPGRIVYRNPAMKLRPGTLGMTAMLAMLTALGPLSTDLYLPSLPGMAAALGSDLARVQLTLSVYLFAFAAGQIVYGPIGDKIGRKPVILAGLALYCVASALCAFAASTELLIAARALQAFGAAGPIVLGRAIVRDIYDGQGAARELSRMGMIMGLVPAVAPVIGGLLDPVFGWRAGFVVLLGCGVALALAVLLLLPETARQTSPGPISFRGILRTFRMVLRHPVFRLNAALTGLTFAGLFAFISGSSFVLQKAYGLSPFQFGLSFSFAVLGYICGSVLTQWLVGPWGLARTMRLGALCLGVSGTAMLGLMAAGTGSSLEITLPMALYASGVGLVLPPANAGAMMPFGENAGAASSLQGLIQGAFAASTGAVMALFLDGRPLVMPLVICVMGLAAAVLVALRVPGHPAQE